MLPRKKKPDLRFNRQFSRTQIGLRALRRRISRRDLSKLRTMRARLHSYAQVECGKHGHYPISNWMHAEVTCEACEKDITGLFSTECAWKQDDPFEGGPWQTTCGNAFLVAEGTPHENEMKYCPYCGLHLVEAP